MSVLKSVSKFSLFPHSSRLWPGALLGICLNGVSVPPVAAQQAAAQNAVPKAAPAPLFAPEMPAVPVAVSDINILILALDDVMNFARSETVAPPAVDLAVPLPALPGVLPPRIEPPLVPEAAAPQAAAPAAPAAIVPAPIVPVPAAPATRGKTPPAITPARRGYFLGRPAIRALARRNSREEKNNELFRLEPEPSQAAGQRVKPDKNAGQTAAPNAGVTAAENAGATNNAMPEQRAPGGAPAAAPDAAVAPDFPVVAPSSPFLLAAPGAIAERPPGAAQSAAAPLRRALLRVGFRDVLATPPDGTSVQRAINSRRLDPRVIDSLQRAAARLVIAAGTSQTPVSNTNANLANVPVPDNAANANAAAPDTNLMALPAGGDAAAPANAGTEELLRPALQAASRIGQALGYRAVIVLSVVPASTNALAAPVAANPNPGAVRAPVARQATYSLLMVDAVRESGEALTFDESGPSELDAHEIAATTGAAVIGKTLAAWAPVSPEEKRARAEKYLASARSAMTAGDYPGAQDALNQVLAFDPNRAEAHSLLGDALSVNNAAAAADAYRRAAEINANDGAIWAKVAVSYTLGDHPDKWPNALKAGEKALALKFDSASLRQAMATAQLGRAELFRRADRVDSAENAELEARRHLDRAMEMAPQDPGTVRLMTRQMVLNRRYAEAVKALDRIALQYPEDLEIQTQYATALLETGGRDEDAFVAWARVWQISGQETVALDALRYNRLAEGFDQRLASLGRRAGQLSASVASNATPREAALLQMTRFREDMTQAATAIKRMQPGFDAQGAAVHSSRIFAADLVAQSLSALQTYLETGQEIYRNRGNELYRQAIVILNSARTARG